MCTEARRWGGARQALGLFADSLVFGGPLFAFAFAQQEAHPSTDQQALVTGLVTRRAESVESLFFYTNRPPRAAACMLQADESATYPVSRSKVPGH